MQFVVYNLQWKVHVHVGDDVSEVYDYQLPWKAAMTHCLHR